MPTLSKIERSLLAQMCTEDGLTEVLDAGLGASVFEEPVNEAIFNHILDYWHQNKVPPTRLIMETDFPGVRFPENVEESTGWLIGDLQKRFMDHQAQEIMREAATQLDDPVKALAVLRDKSSRALNEAGTDGTRSSLRDKLLSIGELAALPPIEPLVDGLLYRDTLAQLSGPPGSYKSFIATAMACAVATGTSFADFQVPRAGVVVYVAAEGGSGLYARIMAVCEAWGIDPSTLEGHLHVLPLPFQLGSDAEVAEMVQVVEEIRPDLLIVDTRARCTVGLDENSATAQGLAIEAAEKIRTTTNSTVLAVHHSARGGTADEGLTHGTALSGPIYESRVAAYTQPSPATSIRTSRRGVPIALCLTSTLCRKLSCPTCPFPNGRPSSCPKHPLDKLFRPQTRELWCWTSFGHLHHPKG